jgi:alpha-mannosidase
VKRQNRRTEHLLMNAERLSAFAWAVRGRPYPHQAFDEAWKALLFNQFHDILAGSSLPAAYEDARDAYGLAAQVANTALNASMQSLTSRIDTRGPGDALVIFNPLPWRVTVPIEVERGSAQLSTSEGESVLAQNVQPTTVVGQRRTCFVAELPALGYKLFRQDAALGNADNPLFKVVSDQPEARAAQSSDDALRITPTSLENAFWRLEVDPSSGQLARLFDKRQQVDVLAAPGNTGIVIDDASDTWSHDVVAYRNEIGRFAEATISIEEEGPVRICLGIETRWGKSTLLQRLYLYRDIDTIECKLTVNWQEHNKMLKLGFPLRLSQPKATYDVAYGCIERTCNGEEEPGQQWLDVSGQAVTVAGETIPYGVSLLNDCKYGFDVLDSEMRMSILRSPIYAYHDPFRPEAHRRYEYMDQGIQTITYQLVPHVGSWQDANVPRRAWELNVRPLWVNEYSHTGTLPASTSFLDAEPANILLSVCKKAEDADALIVRGYESAGRATAATLHLPHWNLYWPVQFKAHEIKSWQITPGMAGEPLTIVEVDLLERPL